MCFEVRAFRSIRNLTNEQTLKKDCSGLERKVATLSIARMFIQLLGFCAFQVASNAFNLLRMFDVVLLIAFIMATIWVMISACKSLKVPQTKWSAHVGNPKVEKQHILESVFNNRREFKSEHALLLHHLPTHHPVRSRFQLATFTLTQNLIDVRSD